MISPAIRCIFFAEKAKKDVASIGAILENLFSTISFPKLHQNLINKKKQERFKTPVGKMATIKID